MTIYILKRLLATIPILMFVGLFVFSLLYITPGDPAVVIAGDTATTEQVDRIRAHLGLDESFVVRLVHWFGAVVQGDLGVSVFSDQPVRDMIVERLEPTFSLSALTMVIAICVAIPLGSIAALNAGRWLDRTIMGIAVLGFSVPVFVVGYVLVMLFSLKLQWLPVQGFVSISESPTEFFRHLILPATTLGLVYTALIARIVRASMLDVMSQDYIRTARSKGLSPWGVVIGHALKNAAVPIATIVGIGIGLLMTGVVVTETVFAIPGLGRLVVDSILRRDYPVIQGVILVFAAVYVLVNLLVDVSYTLFDPRIVY
ncbi:MAG: ABC transporter permease [Proteobacteria bacterium]|nr:ABC transporter permease [Pseudomonadota bacterium]